MLKWGEGQVEEINPKSKVVNKYSTKLYCVLIHSNALQSNTQDGFHISKQLTS